MRQFSAQGLSQSFGQQIVLKGLSFSLTQGQCFALVGQNGVGKTTLLRIISGQMLPDTGHLQIGEATFGKHGWKDSLRREIGVAMGTRMLPPELSPYDFLSFIGQLFEVPKAEWQARRDQLLDWLLPPTDHHKLLRNLSSGNRMKVAVAAAYLPNPSLVLLDEPFNNLDLVGIQQVKALIQGRKAHAITIISSHQLEVLPEVCDQLGILHQGEWAYLGEMTAFQAEGKQLLSKHLLQVLQPQPLQTDALTWQQQEEGSAEESS
ncbi:MAG: ABC transporter ATP-binding protein [Bacteroidota bacterium]